MRYKIDKIAICLSLIYIVHFCGCNPSAPESRRDVSEAVDEHGHDEHDHDAHDHDAHDHDEHDHDQDAADDANDHPETYAEAIALVVKLQLQIKETLAAGDIEAADIPLHAIAHVLEELPVLAHKQSLSEADEEAVKKAVDALFDAFGQIDEKVHGDGKPAYAPYAEKIESAIGILQSFVRQQ